jgi:5-methylcytosine-specific restriction endonuclease McrA
MQNYPALVLNADLQPVNYFPLSLITWEDAIKAVYEKTHFVVAEYERIVHSPSIRMRIPSVLALCRYQPVPKHVAFTRFNVFLRDRFRCQYCGRKKHDSRELTFDHVRPRSQGGQTCWENVVACCSPCNTEKDCQTSMRPLRLPHQPTSSELMAAKRAFPPNYLHETWRDYLYWDTALER